MILFEEDAREEHLDMIQVFKTIIKDSSQVFEIRTLINECFEQEEAQRISTDELIKAFPYLPLKFVKKELEALDPSDLLVCTIEGSDSFAKHMVSIQSTKYYGKSSENS